MIKQEVEVVKEEVETVKEEVTIIIVIIVVWVNPGDKK